MRGIQGVRPFLKWAGNKFRIVDRVIERLPTGNRLVEPFVGSGAVFLNSNYSRYLLCDTNADLISLYQILKKDGERFIALCRHLFTEENNSAERYYAMRAEFNGCTDPIRRAVLFVYLNRHSYNGLCRYNADGGFNAPFGRYKKPYFPHAEMVVFHQKAQRATFVHLDYQKTFKQAKPGDVIYCDPPYVPLSTTANFTSYSAGGFSVEQQEVLGLLARDSAKRNIPVLVSNHNTKLTRKLYKGARVTRLNVQRSISCKANGRTAAKELLALFERKGALK